MSQETPGPDSGTPSLHNTTYIKEEVVVQWDYHYLNTVVETYMKHRYQTVGPQGWFADIKAHAEFIGTLRQSEAITILYVTHSLGIAWKGRVQRATKGSKTSLYRQVDALISLGLLDIVPEKHPELKAAIRIDKGRCKTTNFQITGEAFMISEPYIDVLSDVFRASPDLVPRRIQKRVDEVQREVAKIKNQAAQMQLEFEKAEGCCKVPACKQKAAINGQCAMHYQVMRGR